MQNKHIVGIFHKSREITEMYDFIAFEEDKPDENTISCDEFKALLDICFRHAENFSMNIHKWSRCADKSLELELEPFRERNFMTPVWFGYDMRLFSQEDYWELKVMIYRTDPAAKDILLRYYDDVFLRKRSQDGSFTDLDLTLEDLCFFKDSKLFLGTISHESMLFIDAIDPELETFVKNHGNWELLSPENPPYLIVDLNNY